MKRTDGQQSVFTKTIVPMLFAWILALWAATPQAAAAITVSAAASLGGVVSDVQKAFELKEPGIKVDFNLGSSGALRQQIEHGAPVDVFLSAAQEPVRALTELGLVKEEEVWVFATNRLVLIQSRHTAFEMQSWEDLGRSEIRRIAIGNPDHVPAGQYGKSVLESLGLWETLQRKLVFAEDVRQVLAYVEAGGADAGIVYRTDAADAKRARLVADAPSGSHPPVVYLAAIVRASRQQGPARAFVEFLLSGEGQAILHHHGFGGAGE